MGAASTERSCAECSRSLSLPSASPSLRPFPGRRVLVSCCRAPADVERDWHASRRPLSDAAASLVAQN
eukprot:2214236-Pyramimonas_sp.AAC.1